jgi:hypothetical protein
LRCPFIPVGFDCEIAIVVVFEVSIYSSWLWLWNSYVKSSFFSSWAILLKE